MQDCPYSLCDGSGFVVEDGEDRARECRCRPLRIARAKSRALSAVIPRRYRGVSFDRPPVTEMEPTVVREVRSYVDRVEEHLDAGRGLWFMGDVGTGKTTLAMLVSRAALDARRTVAIYSLPRLLGELRKTFEEGSETSYLELHDRLAAVELLHVDDLGAEKTSPWVLEQLYSIVNARYEDGRAMVVTTNLQPDELREQIGERTVSRLVEICGDPLPLFGPDRRMEPSLAPGPGSPGPWARTPYGPEPGGFAEVPAPPASPGAHDDLREAQRREAQGGRGPGDEAPGDGESGNPFDPTEDVDPWALPPRRGGWGVGD